MASDQARFVDLETRLRKQEQLLADVCLDIVAHQQHHRKTINPNLHNHEEKIGHVEHRVHCVEKIVRRLEEAAERAKDTQLNMQSVIDNQADTLEQVGGDRNEAQSELRSIRALVGADDEESTYDEVRAYIAKMDRRIGDALMESNEQLHSAVQDKRASDNSLEHLREQLTQMLTAQDNCSDYDLLAMVQSSLNYNLELRKQLSTAERELSAQRNRAEQSKGRNKRLMAKRKECRLRLHKAEHDKPLVRLYDDAAADRFATALKAKMKEGRDKGRSGWDDKDACEAEFLSSLFVDHLFKSNEGNYADLGCLLMMLHQRKEDPSLIVYELAAKRHQWQLAGAARMADRLLALATVLYDSPTRSRLLEELKDAKRMVLDDLSAGEEHAKD